MWIGTKHVNCGPDCSLVKGLLWPSLLPVVKVMASARVLAERAWGLAYTDYDKGLDPMFLQDVGGVGRLLVQELKIPRLNFANFLQNLFGLERFV